jgi:EAL domain-containing protein (putative c-di-GMP-specific phosphodiesterase class I)
MLQCRAWHKTGLRLGVAVNLSAENLHDQQFTEMVGGLLGASGSQAGWLTLEVTESAMMQEPARARKVLKELHEMGLRISIDDFGTGYSSLAFLKELPVDEVKVDRSFVKDMLVNVRDACIVRAVVDLGHNLGLKVVAEGVEDEATAEKLASWGCDSAQGFHFSRPLPSEEFDQWLVDRHGIAFPESMPVSVNIDEGGPDRVPSPSPLTAMIEGYLERGWRRSSSLSP